VLSAAVVTSVGIIYTKALRPFVRATMEFVRKINTLDDIAQEFKPNHGSSLRDRIDVTAITSQQAATSSQQAVDEVQKLREDATGFRDTLSDHADVLAEVVPLLERAKRLLAHYEDDARRSP